MPSGSQFNPIYLVLGLVVCGGLGAALGNSTIGIAVGLAVGTGLAAGIPVITKSKNANDSKDDSDSPPAT